VLQIRTPRLVPGSICIAMGVIYIMHTWTYENKYSSGAILHTLDIIYDARKLIQPAKQIKGTDTHKTVVWAKTTNNSITRNLLRLPNHRLRRSTHRDPSIRQS